MDGGSSGKTWSEVSSALPSPVHPAICTDSHHPSTPHFRPPSIHPLMHLFNHPSMAQTHQPTPSAFLNSNWPFSPTSYLHTLFLLDFYCCRPHRHTHVWLAPTLYVALL